jgi:capsular polysaccharide biosynthesis protein
MSTQMAKNYCLSSKLWLKENGIDLLENYFDGYSGGILNRCLPNSIYSTTAPEFRNNLKVEVSDSFVVRLHDARIWGTDGIVIGADERLICDISREFYGGAKNHRIFKQQQIPIEEYIDARIAVLSARSADNNYYHWLFELLPRLHLIEKVGFTTDKIDFFFVSSTHLDFQVETLRILGLPFEKLISSSKKPYVKVKELIATSVPPFDGRIHPWVCTFLRSVFLQLKEPLNAEVLKVLPKRIYISRKEASKRRVLNENDIIEVLKKYDFHVIQLEQMSFMEQVNLFSNVDYVIAPHGAGLSNLVFCNPKIKVIEMFSPKHIEPIYWYLCNILNLDYFYLLGKVLEESDSDMNFQLIDNMYIDLEEFKQTMGIAGIK